MNPNPASITAIIELRNSRFIICLSIGLLVLNSAWVVRREKASVGTDTICPEAADSDGRWIPGLTVWTSVRPRIVVHASCQRMPFRMSIDVSEVIAVAV